MFDDPKEELRQLEEQLLAAEEPLEASMLDEKEFETLYNEILEEFGSQNDEPPVRNFANGYGRSDPQPREIPQPAPPAPEPPVKGNGALIFTLCLEILAIFAVAFFWIMSVLG